MLKLISADIKVLGHRIWAIQVGVFLFIMMFSFIPYLDQVYKIQILIFAVMIPGMLTFELLREEQRNQSDKMLMTMPMDRVKYVVSKYSVVALFCLLAVPAIYLAEYIQLRIELKDIIKSTKIIWVPSIVFLVICYLLPLYFFTKRIISSLVIGLILIGGLSLIIDLIDSFSHYYWNSFNNNTLVYFFKFLGIIISLVILSKILKAIFKNNADKFIEIISYITLLILTIERFVSFQSMLWDYRSDNYSLDLFSGSVKYYGFYLHRLAVLSKTGLDLIIVSMSLLIVLIIFIRAHKTFKEKNDRSFILYLLSPIP